MAAARRPPVDRDVLELIAREILAYADDQVGTIQVAPREMWENEGYRRHRRQAMRRELIEAVTSQGYVPVGLPTETLVYVRMGPPWYGGEVPESADWDTVKVSLEVKVRTPPVDRAAAVRAGILTG